MRKAIIKSARRFFATSENSGGLPKYYANVCLDQGKDYYDYKNHDIEFGNQDDYEIVKKLGSGRYSGAFEGYNILDYRHVTIKILKNVRVEKIRREVKVLQLIGPHPHIPILHEVVIDPALGIPSLILDFAENNDQNFYQVSKDFTPQDVQFYTRKIIETIDYVNSKGIMHRDLKPGNIIIDHKTRNLKIIDWGLAEFFIPGNKLHSRVGTRYWKSPGVICGLEHYHYSIDTWSIGCIFAGLIFKIDHLFKGEDNDQQLYAIAKMLGSGELHQYLAKYKLKMPSAVETKIGNLSKKDWGKKVNQTNEKFASIEAIDLINKMLKYDHNERISLKDALLHPYFKKTLSQQSHHIFKTIIHVIKY